MSLTDILPLWMFDFEHVFYDIMNFETYWHIFKSSEEFIDFFELVVCLTYFNFEQRKLAPFTISIKKPPVHLVPFLAQ